MKKDNKLVVAIVLAAVLLAGVAMNTQAVSYSAKTAAGYNETFIFGPGLIYEEGTNEEDPAPDNYGASDTKQLMFQPLIINAAQQKDFVISVTAVTNIVTDTRLRGEFGETDSVKIAVRPVVTNLKTGDVHPVYPSEVTFASRIQTIEGRLSDAVYVCEEGKIPSEENCSWDYSEAEWINLILNTTNANGFNFICPDLIQGDHEIVVWVTIESSSTGGPIPEGIAGTVGPRTLIVNEVALANAYVDHEL